ncbi:hypothetical protein BD770DRAFT_388256 [Pilaira anomala]|nr:hypothetical protein BD770DRAFT_388256 [Pilaira anomala]
MAACILACPASTKCNCNEIHTPEGTYRLQQEIYEAGTFPYYTVGTHISFFGQSNDLPLSRSSSETSYDSLKPTMDNNGSGGGGGGRFLFHHHNKHRKPKTNLTKSKSCFIDYVIHDQKVTDQRSSSDSNIFYNVGLKFFWNDESHHLQVHTLYIVHQLMGLISLNIYMC